jgi:hypothetical protein
MVNRWRYPDFFDYVDAKLMTDSMLDIVQLHLKDIVQWTHQKINKASAILNT